MKTFNNTIPFIASELPGIGGIIKERPEHFKVEELPLYKPVGDGEHVFLRLFRESFTTRSIQEQLASTFGLRDSEVGVAGLKDKHAQVIQTFSLWLPKESENEIVKRVESELGFQVIDVGRHRNKLKTGHLLGNRFQIIVCEPVSNALNLARQIAEHLRENGLPNFYGLQRFGRDGENIRKGREVLHGKGHGKKWLRKLFISSYQSHLFNEWLSERISRGWFDQILLGDIAKKTETGGLFQVEDLEESQERFKKGEITYTGPIYGSKMRWPEGIPGELEHEIFKKQELSIELFKKTRTKGSRRPARLNLSDLTIESCNEGLLFSFSLPKGAYATIVLREFMK